MEENLKQIPSRIKELREILGYPSEQLARALNIPVSQYEAYESGEHDIPISTLYKIASELGTDFTVLLTGEAPRMNTHTVVRNGNGVKVDRYEGYSFSSLAFNYIGRNMEPMIVTLQHSDETPSLVVHGGQEFNYVLSGSIKVIIGNHDYVLNQGDSIYFDPRLPHGQTAVGGKASFLTVIQE